jgi:tRNA pseudouridine55 synthase
MARQGEEGEREARPIIIHEIRLLDFTPGDFPEVSFLVRCGTGTYVRTLADDIAIALGGRAHLTALRRTGIGALDVSDASSLEGLEDAAAAGSILDRVMTPSMGLAGMPAVPVADEVARGVTHGTPFPASVFGAMPDGPIRVLGSDGALLAVYRVEGENARPEVVLS